MVEERIRKSKKKIEKKGKEVNVQLKPAAPPNMGFRGGAKGGWDDIPPFTQWLITSGAWIKKSDKITSPSHLLLSGGKFRIEPKNLNSFRFQYAQAIKAGEKLYVSECRTNIFRMLSDLDYLDHQPISLETTRAHVEVIQQVMNDFFEGEYTRKELRVIICTTGNIQKMHDGQEYTKTGVHLIWPDITVDAAMGLKLRRGFVQQLTKNFGSRSDYNSWSDVVDEAVYTSSGLRMLGSRKMFKCKKCKGKKDLVEDCEVCNDYGKVEDPRFYSTTVVLDGDCREMKKETRLLKSDFYKSVKSTCLRTDLSEPAKPFIDPLPSWYSEPTVDETKKEKKRQQRRRKLVPLGKEDRVGSDNLKFQDQIGPETQIFTLVEKTARKIGGYDDVLVLDLHRCDEGAYYVARTNSHFCLNINREHNSNTIYFYINPFGMYQKCFCNCDTIEGRLDGRCSEWRSMGHPLSEGLKSKLFPSIGGKRRKAVLNELPGYGDDHAAYISALEERILLLEEHLFDKAGRERQARAIKAKKLHKN